MELLGYLRKSFILALFSQLCFAANAYSLEVVYPKSLKTEITANSTFFIGNTKVGSKLTINNKEVKVFDNGSFVEVVALNDGENEIKIESKLDEETDVLSYVVKKVPKDLAKKIEAELIEFPENEYIYAMVAKNNVPLRTKPDENAYRLSHVNKDTVLLLNGKKGDFYRVSLSPSKSAWVRADYVVNCSTIQNKMFANIESVKVDEDKLYTYIKTKMSFPVPYVVKEIDKGLTLDLYNIAENPADTKQFKPLGALKNLAINTVSPDNQSTYFVELNQKLWGYSVFYENSEMVLKIRKAPNINSQKVFDGITIAIDAGHGGKDAGAIGPTGVKEKDINFDVSKKLQAILEELGAKVVLTRVDDTDVPLYQRPQIAVDENALILISIHANALPDGADPYKKHGTSVFYYNNQAREFAQTLKDTMIEELKTQDDGLCNCSFVLTRPTMPLSVLVEVAYMIHPEEYSLLLDEEFRQKAAISIKNALEKYLLNSIDINVLQ